MIYLSACLTVFILGEPSLNSCTTIFSPSSYWTRDFPIIHLDCSISFLSSISFPVCQSVVFSSNLLCIRHFRKATCDLTLTSLTHLISGLRNQPSRLTPSRTRDPERDPLESGLATKMRRPPLFGMDGSPSSPVPDLDADFQNLIDISHMTISFPTITISNLYRQLQPIPFRNLIASSCPNFCMINPCACFPDAGRLIASFWIHSCTCSISSGQSLIAALPIHARILLRSAKKNYCIFGRCTSRYPSSQSSFHLISPHLWVLNRSSLARPL